MYWPRAVLSAIWAKVISCALAQTPCDTAAMFAADNIGTGVFGFARFANIIAIAFAGAALTVSVATTSDIEAWIQRRPSI
eukprot:COSAG01_NODE_44351_length_420_cov_0.635514_1_plen_80_part_00